MKLRIEAGLDLWVPHIPNLQVWRVTIAPALEVGRKTE